MVFFFLHHYLDRFVEVRVVALTPGGGIEIDIEIRSDAMVFDFPLAVQAVDRGARRGDVAAIEQLGITADADQDSPGALADERADAGFAEIPRQGVAAGSRHFVNHHHLGAVDGFGWAGPVVAFAGDALAHQRTLQIIDDVVGELAAFIEALVDDCAFFADLRKEIPVEAGVACATGIWNVNVGDAATGSLIDFAAIVFDPCEMAEIFFALDGNDRDFAGIFAVGTWGDSQDNLLPGGFFEETVDGVGGVQGAAVDGDDVVAGFDVDAGLGARGLQPGIRVFAVVNFRDAVAAILQAVICAEQSAFDFFRFGRFAAADEHVAHRQFTQTFFE